MDEEVKADALLETDNALDLLLDELLILGFGNFLLVELGAGLTDLLGLREGTDRGRGELRELKLLLLELLADGEGALALEHVGSDSSNTATNSRIRVTLKLTALGDGYTVRLNGLRDLGVLRAGQRCGEDRDFRRLLESE